MLELVDDLIVFEFVQDLAADDVDISIETSADLAAWADGSADFTASVPEYLGDGGQRVILQAPSMDLPTRRFYVRLRVTLKN